MWWVWVYFGGWIVFDGFGVIKWVGLGGWVIFWVDGVMGWGDYGLPMGKRLQGQTLC